MPEVVFAPLAVQDLDEIWDSLHKTIVEVANRVIDRIYESHSVTSHYRSHKTERVERERVYVYTFIGRRIQHVFPKGFKRLRYDGVVEGVASEVRCGV